jgi:hypothetical protein
VSITGLVNFVSAVASELNFMASIHLIDSVLLVLDNLLNLDKRLYPFIVDLLNSAIDFYSDSYSHFGIVLF